MNELKRKVQDFWEEASCGEKLLMPNYSKAGYLQQSKIRYELDPCVIDFAEFPLYKGKKVLEIGVGLGADHQEFACGEAVLYGIDFTKRAIAHTIKRFSLLGLTSKLQVADAENLPFNDNCFDMVYSWGVLHHSPDTNKAFKEIYRVLKPGGKMKVMIYHKYSIVAYILWVRYALLSLKPMTSLEDICSNYLESPGTKVYSIGDARRICNKFVNINIKTMLSAADLLVSPAGQRHRGLLLFFARLIFPRWIIRKFLPNHGMLMLIEGEK